MFCLMNSFCNITTLKLLLENKFSEHLVKNYFYKFSINQKNLKPVLYILKSVYSFILTYFTNSH